MHTLLVLFAHNNEQVSWCGFKYSMSVMVWMHLAQNTVKWWGVLSTVVNCQVP